MNCEPLQLHVDPNATPVAVHKPALVPIHLQDKVYADLERDVRIGVLERVSQNTSTTWFTRIVVTSKADGTPRRTVDLQPQNGHSVRQTHRVPSPFHLADRVPQGMKKKQRQTLGMGTTQCLFVKIAISRHSSHYGGAAGTGLSTGIHGHRLNAWMTHVCGRCPLKQHSFQACEWLDLCARNCITLNPKMFQFAKETVTVNFAGLTTTQTNIRPSTKFLDAISNFPTPTDITGARAWFGLINQAAYAFAMARQMKPFLALLKPSTIFCWTKELDEVFHKSKEIII
ncbi:unnamed protein product [Mytilus coruscus]|uniref:Reverse transcriptase/retrotransposon-derived protein RNase H-like domain-containing protein n=1 Tax=Mytilus coruscus TaxID=42192 RepID=A0A6J8BD14_MYTCO|nr:unnamed protein product [Mytilus coruscus]